MLAVLCYPLCPSFQTNLRDLLFLFGIIRKVAEPFALEVHIVNSVELVSDVECGYLISQLRNVLNYQSRTGVLGRVFGLAEGTWFISRNEARYVPCTV